MNNVGVIPIYYNNTLINSDFSRVNGLNFTGAGVTINAPSVSFIGGIGIANIDIRYTQVTNAIGDYANLSYLRVSPGITTVNFLNGIGANFSGIITASSFNGNLNCSDAVISGIITSPIFKSSSLNLTNNIDTNINNLSGVNGKFTGIITASKYFGDIYASQGLISGIVTATQYLSGGLDGNSVASESLNCGIATIQFLTANNVIHSGILTSSLIKGGDVNTNSISVSSGITTVGVLTGTSAYFTGVSTSGDIIVTTLNGTLTGPSSLSGNIDISNTLFTGNVDSLLNQFKILPSYRKIVYVDGNISRTNVSDTGAATSGITTEIWIDIWDNSKTHGISTSGWVRGTAPGTGTTAYTVGSRQCFSNINQTFRWIGNRNPSDNSPITINLYKTSSSNESLSSGTAVVNTYLGNSEIIIQRGPSQPRLSVGITTYSWGPEHYSGHFNAPNSKLVFNEVNLNCAGSLSNPDRAVFNRNTYIISGALSFTTSRLKFIYDGSILTNSFMFFVVSNKCSSSIELYWQKNPDIYNLYSSDSNKNEFIFNVLNSANLTPNGGTSLFYCKKFSIYTRIGKFAYPKSANLNIVMNVLNQGIQPISIIKSASSIFQLDGGRPDDINEYYGGLKMNLDISGGNIQKLFFVLWFNQGSRFVYVLESISSHSLIDITINQNKINDLSDFIAFSLDNSYILNSLSIDNNESFIKKLMNAVSLNVQKTYYILGCGSVFNSQFYRNGITQTL